MAPPGMFSYLRHRRTPSSSNPTSPTHPTTHSSESPLQATDEIFPSTRVTEAESSHTNQVAQFQGPPVLAPIPRIVSDEEPLVLENTFNPKSSHVGEENNGKESGTVSQGFAFG